MTHRWTTADIPTRSLPLPAEPSLPPLPAEPPGHVYCVRCSMPTPRDAARPVHVRWHLARWPLRTFHCGEAPARRWRRGSPPRYLCPQCASRAHPSDACRGGRVVPDSPTVLTFPVCGYCRPSRSPARRPAVDGVPAPIIALRPGLPPGWGDGLGAGGRGDGHHRPGA